MRRHRHFPALISVLLLLDLACTKQSPPPVSTFEPVAAPVPVCIGTTQSVLQKTFVLKASAAFPFEIPAHAVQPHLHGIFESFAGKVHGASDDSANIDLLILNEAQNGDFGSNRPSEALFSVEA